TWPAITACVTPASFKRLINLPSCPSEIQWNAAAGARAATSASSGNVSSWRPTTVTSWPAPRAASSTRKGKRPFPAIKPRRMSFVRDHFLGAAGRATKDHATLRRADEVDQVLHLGAGERLVLFDLLQRPRRVQLRLQQVAERTLDLGDDVEREAAAHQADRVGAVDARRAAADRPRKRQRVLGHHRVAADERVAADAAELVD